MQIVPRRTSRPLTDEEKRDPVLQREMENFMKEVRRRYGDKLKVSKEAKASAEVETVINNEDKYPDFVPYEDEDEEP